MAASVGLVQNERLTGALVAAIAIGAVAIANFVAEGENGGMGPFLVSVAVILVLAAVIFGRVLPGAGDAARTALILAIVALVTVAVFWSGIPQVLAPAAILLGYSATQSGRGGQAKAAVAIGAVAYVLSLVAVFVG